VKYIFITGGSISALGKGVATASIGNLLKSYNQRVTCIKIDPYINIDPGTLSPYQHGEVYVTEDGYEADLDIGHYERFLGDNLTSKNNMTTGQIYQSVIDKERRGFYKGHTVQVIPHVTNEIIEFIHRVGGDDRWDVIIVEVGGTVGDIESSPFLEAIRLFSLGMKKEDVLQVHLTLVPYFSAAGEVKTKLAQHSVKTLHTLGIFPDLLLCRTDRDIPLAAREKISLFCNVPLEAVIVGKDVETIYEIPLSFYKQNVHTFIIDRLQLNADVSDNTNLDALTDIVHKIKNPTNNITIGIIGKYVELHDAYKSIIEAFIHAGAANDCHVHIKWISAQSVIKNGADKMLNMVNGILVPGGFGERGTEGKIETVRYARENKLPYFGICLGMHIAVVEYARHVCGLDDANSTEFDADTAHPVIHMIEEKKSLENIGGTLRLGGYRCSITAGSLAERIYTAAEVVERHRHRYEFNNEYRKIIQDNGMVISGIYEEKDLVEIVELPDHPFFIGVQFHPEFKSRLSTGHPLFNNFVHASLEHKKNSMMTDTEKVVPA